MKKHKKLLSKVASLVLATSILAGQCTPFAKANIPQDYWQYQEPYQTARDQKDYETMIPIALNIQNLMESQEDSQEKRNILYDVYDNLAVAYQEKQDFQTAIVYLEKQAEYAKLLGFDDAVILAEKRILQIDPMTEVYALSTNHSSLPFYNAKNEPAVGAYFGRCIADIPVQNFESALSIYVEFLGHGLSSFDYIIEPYDDGTKMIQVCLNMPNEASDLRKVMDSSSDSYLISMLQYMATLKSPVFLRIAGEMNVYTDLPTTDEFKSAYIKIAQLARQYAPNVALVFSPNSISTWGMSHTAYYPGDEYVDWVGMSAYTHLYYNAYDPYGTADYNNMFYGTGSYADPIKNLREIVETFGDRKPIIITESGSGYAHLQLPELNSSLQAFSQSQLEKLFTYANMVYPQVKCVINFDENGDKDTYQYSMSNNTSLFNTYTQVTNSNPTLRTSVSEQKSLAYVTAGDYTDKQSTLRLASYSAPVDAGTLSVSYLLNGNAQTSQNSIPYTCEMDVSGLSVGTHALEVRFQSTTGFSETKYYSLEKSTDSTVTLNEASQAVTPNENLPTLPVNELPNATLYSSYLQTVPNINSNATVISGILPKGLGLYPDGTIGGIPAEKGRFEFTLGTDSGEVAYGITVVENTQSNVEADNDYEIINRVPTITNNDDNQVFLVSGEFSQFLNVYLDGDLLVENVDYLVEEGSTKITVLSSTFAQLDPGSHTINATFTPVNVSTSTSTSVSSNVTVEKVAQTFEKTAEKTTVPAMPFGDVSSGDWFYDYVLFMYKKEIVKGISDSAFGPETKMSRAMLSVVLYALAEKPETTSANYSDVTEGIWYADAVNWVGTQGIDDSVGNFRPNEDITREEAAKFLYNYTEAQGEWLPLTSSASPNDLDSVDPSAKTHVDALFQRGIFSGDTKGNFNPKETANRAEISVIINNFVKTIS